MQEKYSDNQLVEFINDGKYEYLQVLIDRYMPCVISMASNYNVSGLDDDDFIQEGFMAIFSAVRAYNPEKASFKTFVSLCIERAMSAALARAAGKAKHIPDKLITPIDDVELADNNDPESILIEKENYNNLAQAIKRDLSQFEYQVLCEFLGGKSYALIAETLGVSVKSVDNALRRIRSKIKSN
ncbi:MAG: sigma-70 family RNA polymerase sigma factor [Clostridia bacterium]|nr:sigma-70 family RNA polymerase sigma factor [Clostridia bacterium]